VLLSHWGCWSRAVIGTSGQSLPSRSHASYAGGHATSAWRRADRHRLNEPLLTGVYDVTLTGTNAADQLGESGRAHPVGTGEDNRGSVFSRKVTVVEYRPIYDALTRSRRLLKPEGSLTAAAGTGVLVQHVGDQVWNEYPLLSSIEILPGDIIRIPERYF
jgi:hypothetical protein